MMYQAKGGDLMENNEKQESTTGFDINLNGEPLTIENKEFSKEEVQKMVSEIRAAIENTLAPLNEGLKALKNNYQTSDMKQTLQNGLSSVKKPLIEKVKEDGRLKIKLNGETIVDVEMPQSSNEEA